MSDETVGGRLKYFLPVWSKLTNDKTILQIISEAKLEFKRCVFQKFSRKPIKCTLENKVKVYFEIDKYFSLDMIEKAVHFKCEFVNQIFPTAKKSGGVRIILNLKPLNVDIEYKHFKMENLNSALSLMEDNCFMASSDLKDVYYFVNIDESYRKYLRLV